jgi:hypothetical protein
MRADEMVPGADSLVRATSRLVGSRMFASRGGAATGNLGRHAAERTSRFWNFQPQQGTFGRTRVEFQTISAIAGLWSAQGAGVSSPAARWQSGWCEL